MRFRVLILSLLAVAMTGLGAPALADVGAAQTSIQAVAAAWAPYTSYATGAVVTHNGVDYQCLQGHTSLPGWEPDRVPALWKVSTGGPNDPTPPSTPGNLRVTGTSSSTVSLAWDASTDNVGVTGYEVYRGTALVTTVTGTTYTDSNLNPSSTYTYKVRARDAAGNRSPESDPVSATTQGDNGAPGQPGTASATTTNNSITLTWGASSGTVTGYRVYEGTTQRAQVTATSATISGLGTCETHNYTIKAYNSVGESAGRDVSATTTGCTGPDRLPGAPYLYMGWGNPPNPGTVMDATGVKSFTMAFILAQNGCNPAWDGQRPLTGGSDAAAINTIKTKGGSVEISFGGWSGNKLGPNCSTPEAFAGAVQKVIDALGPAAVDFDIENTDEFENYTVQDRILNALKIVRQKNPNVKIVVTIPTFKTALSAAGVRLVNQAKALGSPIDNFTIMPFNFSGTDMYQDTVNASEGLKTALKNAYGWNDAQAYAHMGISGMNGKSDQGETTSPAQWTQIRDWAKAKGLTRLSFWAVNRDRVNGGGVPQAEWEFTRITAGF
ncbi:fibronectin type III domain-containing protein [Streptosporangium algeriense]|uniref:Fibronectin type III domain-containing protein n=1 Tax=Streptosporangium algeriense TaxID=1682748 RepID=A0ABW3DW38_9ACTN